MEVTQFVFNPKFTFINYLSAILVHQNSVSNKTHNDSELCQCFYLLKSLKHRGFPGGAVVKNPPANAGDTGSSPGLERSHMPRSN